MAVGLVGGGVNGVSIWAHLEDDGIHVHGLEPVQDADEFGFLGAGAEAFAAGPVDIINAGDPSASEFARDLRGAFAIGDVGLRGEGAEEKKGSENRFQHYEMILPRSENLTREKVGNVWSIARDSSG